LYVKNIATFHIVEKLIQLKANILISYTVLKMLSAMLKSAIPVSSW